MVSGMTAQPESAVLASSVLVSPSGGNPAPYQSGSTPPKALRSITISGSAGRLEAGVVLLHGPFSERDLLAKVREALQPTEPPES